MSRLHAIRAFLVVLFAGCAMSAAQTPDPQQKPTSALSPEQMVEEALRRFDVGDFNEAVSYMQKAKALKPDIEKLKLVEGLIFLEQRPKRSAEAIKLLNEYNQTPEGKNDYRGNAAVGMAYKDSYAYRLAVVPLERAKKLAPMEQDGKPIRALITMNLAQAYLGMKNDKQAIAAAKDAESLAPNDPGIQLDLGRIATSTKDFDAAVKAADRSIGLLNAKAKTDPFKNEDVKRLVEAAELKIKLFNAKLDQNPKDAQAMFDLSVAWRERAEIDRRMALMKARDAGLKGIAQDPKLFRLAVMVASIEAELGGLQDALDRLNDIINNDPENQAAIKLRSEVQARLNAPRP